MLKRLGLSAWTSEKIKEHLREGAVIKFDPRVVDIFLKMMENKAT
jgi:HD-GYP domain-containing protein (c-di-GMP phosphodiesterase class II)